MAECQTITLINTFDVPLMDAQSTLDCYLIDTLDVDC